MILIKSSFAMKLAMNGYDSANPNEKPVEL